MNAAVKKKSIASGAEVNAIGAELAGIRDKLDLEYKRAQAQSRKDEEDAVVQMEAMAARTLDLASAEWTKRESSIARAVAEADDSLRNTLTEFRSGLERCSFDDIVRSFVARAIRSDPHPEEEHS